MEAKNGNGDDSDGVSTTTAWVVSNTSYWPTICPLERSNRRNAH